ncbi:MAG: YHS domain-containing protein [Nitrospirota bacterium]
MPFICSDISPSMYDIFFIRAGYEGKTYYFCAVGCRESFEKEPEKYVKATEEHGQKHQCC